MSIVFLPFRKNKIGYGKSRRVYDTTLPYQQKESEGSYRKKLNEKLKEALSAVLPFAMGACSAVSGDIVRDAFGVAAMVAMTSLLTFRDRVFRTA